MPKAARAAAMVSPTRGLRITSRHYPASSPWCNESFYSLRREANLRVGSRLRVLRRGLRFGGMERHLDEDLPPWTTWRGGPWSSQFTVGIEEELMLVDPRDGSLAFRSDAVVADLPRALNGRVSLETHAAVIEVATGIHRRVGDATIELANRRSQLAG